MRPASSCLGQSPAALVVFCGTYLATVEQLQEYQCCLLVVTYPALLALSAAVLPPGGLHPGGKAAVLPRGEEVCSPMGRAM